MKYGNTIYPEYGREGGGGKGGGEERMDAGYHTLQTGNYSTLGAPTWVECG